MPDNGCDVVVVGASAGGVEALSALARALPPDFAAPVRRRPARPRERDERPPAHPLACRRAPGAARRRRRGARAGDDLRRPAQLPHSRRRPQDHARSRPARERSSPRDRPALPVRGRRLRRPVGRRRPLRNARRRHGRAPRDQARGGATLVQDPEEALYTSMPASAIRYVHPDYVLPTRELVDVLVRLTAKSGGPRPETTRVGAGNPANQAAPAPAAEHAQPGELVPFSCPDCGGSLWATMAGELETFRCRVGHAFSLNSVAARHGEMLERALWTAYRALEERAAMSRRIARRLADRGSTESAERFHRQAAEAVRQAEGLKRILGGIDAAPAAESGRGGGRELSSGHGRGRRVVRGADRLHQGEPRLRFQRLQAPEPPAADPEADGADGRRRLRRVPRRTSRSTATSSGRSSTRS